MRRLILLSLVAVAVLGAVPADAAVFNVVSRSVTDEKAVFATVESISVVPARGRIGGIIVQLNVREGDLSRAVRRLRRSATRNSPCR